MTTILKRISAGNNKGAFLENIIEAVLKDQKFINVRRQKSGSQYGYDVIGYKDLHGKRECWKAECKNLSLEATIADIAPKLIWHIDSLTVDRFIIVSVNGISNDLNHLLEKKIFSFPIELWHGEYLEKVISESPAALKILGLPVSECSQKMDLEPVLFLPNEIKFGVVYPKGSPFSYDYFLLNEKIIKAYTEHDFRLTATINNPTNRTIIVQEIIVRTLKYAKTESLRVLRQFTQKGIIEPLKLTFIPKPNLLGEMKLNEGELLEVRSNTREFIEFKLSQKSESGYYEIIFEIVCVDGNKRFSLFSQVFSFHKKTAQNDILYLCISDKFYDTPVKGILNLNQNVWSKIKRDYPNTIKYLGPTLNDIHQGEKIGNSWSVRLVKGKMEGKKKERGLIVKATTKSFVLEDLHIPIEEALFSL